MQKVDVFVPTRRVVWLPAIIVRDKDGNRTNISHPKFLLSHGSNQVPKPYWDKVSAMDQVQLMLDTEQIVEGAPAKKRAAAAATSPDAARGLVDLTIANAGPFIEASSDPEELARWRNADRRAGIHNAIDERMSFLMSEDADDDDVDDVDDLDDIEDTE